MGQEVLHPNSPYGIDQAMLLSHAYETVGIISELRKAKTSLPTNIQPKNIKELNS